MEQRDMKKYMKPAITLIAVEPELIMAGSYLNGVGGTPDFDTEVSAGPGTGTYYSNRHTSVWGLDEDE